MKSLSESCQKSGGETMETIRISTGENFVSIIFSLFQKKETKNGKIDFWTFLKINKTINIKIANKSQWRLSSFYVTILQVCYKFCDWLFVRWHLCSKTCKLCDKYRSRMSVTELKQYIFYKVFSMFFIRFS